jgi:hypothetical protein
MSWQDLPGDNTRNWSRRRRSGWWVKYVAIVVPMTTILTALATCGGVRLLGAQTVADAEKQHQALASEIKAAEERNNQALQTSLSQVNSSVSQLTTRLDAFMAAQIQQSRGRR